MKKNTTGLKLSFIIIAISATLVACGGGGGSSAANQNVKPIDTTGHQTPTVSNWDNMKWDSDVWN